MAKNDSLQQTLEAAQNAALEAGKIALRYFRGNFDVRIKSDRSLVTKADLEAEQKISEILKQKSPQYEFLGE